MRDEQRTIRIPDISNDIHSVGFPANHPDMRSFLVVPIMRGGVLLGQLYLTDKLEYHEFTEQDERVIETLASYAAVAITNARLYEKLVEREGQLSRRNEDLKLLNEAAVALTKSLELDEILDTTLGLLISYLGIEAGEIFLREDEGKSLSLALHKGEFEEPFSHMERFRIGQGCIGTVAATGKPSLSDNLRKDMRYLRPAVMDAGFQSIACIPLTAGGKVVGVMSAATSKDHHLGEREMKILTAIGAWAGITIENARLNRQSRRLAVLEERERIGRDLHDGIIQSIYGVGLALDYARVALDESPDEARGKITDAIGSLNRTIRDIRAYILDLQPRRFHGDDLKKGLQRLIDEFQANCVTRVLLDGPESTLMDFPSANATALFHICQESLANIAKHASAQHADVHLWNAKDRVLLEVADNGGGLSTLGKGTTVLAWVPRWGV